MYRYCFNFFDEKILGNKLGFMSCHAFLMCWFYFCSMQSTLSVNSTPQFLANIIASKKLLIAQLAMLCGVDCNKTYGIRPKMPRKRPMNRAYWWGWNLAPFFCCQEECHVIWQVSDWSDIVVLSDTCQVKWRSSWQQKIGALDLLTPRLIVWIIFLTNVGIRPNFKGFVWNRA